MAGMLRYRLRPRGFVAFLRCAYLQRKHLHDSWPASVRRAWLYGPIR